MKRILAAIALAAGLVAPVACAGTANGDGTTTTVTPVSNGPDIVTYQGTGDIRFGDSRQAVEQDHGMVQTAADCAPRLPDQPAVSPVFDDGQLVLLWADPPLHTPEGVAVGTAVDDLRAAYPDAEVLTAPPGSYQFDGLLVPHDDRAYLFLHDGQEVQKVIAGYAEHARLLFHEGFGTC